MRKKVSCRGIFTKYKLLIFPCLYVLKCFFNLRINIYYFLDYQHIQIIFNLQQLITTLHHFNNKHATTTSSFTTASSITRKVVVGRFRNILKQSFSQKAYYSVSECLLDNPISHVRTIIRKLFLNCVIIILTIAYVVFI